MLPPAPLALLLRDVIIGWRHYAAMAVLLIQLAADTFAISRFLLCLRGC